MKCERCHKNKATQAVKGQKNGRSCELFVCDACVRKAPVKPSPLPLSLADILFSLGNAKKPGTEEKSASAYREAGEQDEDTFRPPAFCKYCGISRDRVRDTGRLGCSKCYSVFHDDVEAFIREMQYSDKHVGRHPVKIIVEETITDLKIKLAAAIDREDFYKAAEIRNALDRLETPTEPPSGSQTDGETQA